VFLKLTCGRLALLTKLVMLVLYVELFKSRNDAKFLLKTKFTYPSNLTRGGLTSGLNL
jgi:hypothetical protein